MINPLILSPIIDIGKTLIERWFPDPEKKREAEADFLKMAMGAELQQVLAQLEINAKEAAHPSLLVAGGRPAFMWIGAFGFAYATIIQPFLVWFSAIKGFPPPPVIDSELLWVVVTGLLGIGGLRSFEKNRGITK